MGASTDAVPGSTAQLQWLVEHMPVFLGAVERDGTVLWVNRSPTGRPTSELVGARLQDFLPPGADVVALEAIARVFDTGAPDRYTLFGPGKRGPRSRYETWLSPLREGDRTVAVAIASRDVSDEWEVHEALRDREQRLSLALRASGLGMWRFDFPSTTVELDEGARAIYGITVASLPSREFTSTYIHPEDRASADAAALSSVTKRQPYASENRILRSDGAVRWVAIMGMPIAGEDGRVSGILGTVSDITERREIEATARQAQKLEAVGQLTAGVAHNFNNMLAGILPALEIVSAEVSPSSMPLVQGAIHASERAAQLVQDLMTFSGRARAAQRREEEPAAIVERTLRLCRSTFDRGIRLEVELEGQLPSVLVDSGAIEQALLNVLLNARDAALASAAPVVRVEVRNEGEDHVAFVIRDNGPGVPVAIRGRVFDPFFTTKEVGRGTGLGLSTAYAIVREHGGSIRCDDGEPGGACFTVVLPRAVGAGVQEAGRTAARRKRTVGVVLVIDDDPQVRLVVSRVLLGAGYLVHVARDGEEALDRLDRLRPPDVVLLDLDMPGLPWARIVERVRADTPGARIVAFTGSPIAPRLDTFDGWLPKPAAPDAILDAVALKRPGEPKRPPPG